MGDWIEHNRRGRFQTCPIGIKLRGNDIGKHLWHCVVFTIPKAIRSIPMSTTIPQVSQRMREVLETVAKTSARARGFDKRRSKLSGAVFAQTLVFGWLRNPQATLENLAQTAAALGVKVSPQALDQRFGPEASAHLKDVLDASVSRLVSSDGVSIPVFERFSAVVLQDSSTVRLPDELEQIWEGFGGTNAHGASAIKLQA